MKRKMTMAVATVTVLGATILLTRQVSAHGRFGSGAGRENAQYRLVPEEMRSQFMNEYHNLSEEERISLREQRSLRMGMKHRHIEEFTGLSMEEIRERVRNGESLGDIIHELGKSPEEAEAFLTDLGNKKVDTIVESHNLSEEDASNLYSRVSEWVSNILSRWF